MKADNEKITFKLILLKFIISEFITQIYIEILLINISLCDTNYKHFIFMENKGYGKHVN